MLLRRGLVYAAAAAITLTVWLLAFRPGPGPRADGLLAVHARDSEKAPESGSLRLYSVEKGDFVVSEKVTRTEEEWKQTLSPMEYRILREKGTERPFTGDLLDNKEKGTYICAACGADLFSSEAKFESGTGWPSFYAPVAEENVSTEADDSLGMSRVEVLCSRCGGHLGHVFSDGPRPTGLRYCVNSASLDFKKSEE